MGSFRPAAGNPCLHGSHNFAESLVETALSSLRHSCRSELHALPVARGVDYTFISLRGFRLFHRIDLGEHKSIPGFFLSETPACCGVYEFGLIDQETPPREFPPEVVTGLTAISTAASLGITLA